MGYIKTEEAIEELYRYGFVSRETIAKNIRAIPSIDIVRCKECKHWLNHKYADCDQNDFVYYCAVHKVSFSGKDFCSYGEREGE